MEKSTDNLMRVPFYVMNPFHLLLSKFSLCLWFLMVIVCFHEVIFELNLIGDLGSSHTWMSIYLPRWGSVQPVLEELLFLAT